LTARSTARLRRNTIPATTATPSKNAVTADAALGGDLLGGRGGEGGGGRGAGAGACSHASVSLDGLQQLMQRVTQTHDAFWVREQPRRLFASSFSKTQSLPRQEQCGQLLLGLEPISAGRCWCTRPGAKSTSTRRTESSHAKNRKGAAKKIDEIRLKSSWIAPKLCTAIRNEDKKLLLGDHCSI